VTEDTEDDELAEELPMSVSVEAVAVVVVDDADAEEEDVEVSPEIIFESRMPGGISWSVVVLYSLCLVEVVH